MKNIIVVLGSARRGRVADAVAGYVREALATRTMLRAQFVDLAELNLPFYNNEHSPSSPDFKETNAAVTQWSQAVTHADAVVMLTPEYNHNLSALQKNAIDWLFPEWNNKPVVVIAYGWHGGKHALNVLRETATVVKFDLQEHIAQLTFNKELHPDGSLLNESEVRARITAALDDISHA